MGGGVQGVGCRVQGVGDGEWGAECSAEGFVDRKGPGLAPTRLVGERLC